MPANEMARWFGEGRFDEARLFEIASAYEAGTKHPRPPKGFGPLAGEPEAERDQHQQRYLADRSLAESRK
jgi:hypothetical protein